MKNTLNLNNLKWDTPIGWDVYSLDNAILEIDRFNESYDNTIFYLVIMLFLIGFLLILLCTANNSPAQAPVLKTKMEISYITHDETLRRITSQVSISPYNKLDCYSERYPRTSQLDTEWLRADFSRRMLASNNPMYKIEMGRSHRFSGELVVKYTFNINYVAPNNTLITILRNKR